MKHRMTLLALWLAGGMAACFALAWGLLAALGGSSRAVRVAVAMDQAANAALGGSEDETISSRAAKGTAQGIWHWCLLCRVLGWIDAQHCQRSLEVDEGEPVLDK
ncbi:hypothetical protein [Gulbenkiania mobilis]|uniref:hypothetical protein n=1 Tax=Gulbenkiania mobilis TaxID=397457 RepID=UPI0006BBBE06|nr:hypothetical protein [Gulbenkiania mobilis]